MDRRTFIQTTFTNLGALAFGARLSSAGFGNPLQPQQSPTGRLQGPPPGGGALREIDLVAEPTQFEVPTHGVFQKWLYNGQFPGPEIRAKEGERLRLTVKNHLPEATTI